MGFEWGIVRTTIPVASLARGIGGDGHGSRTACHGSLLESEKNNAQKFASTRYYEVKPLYVLWNLLSMRDLRSDY